MLPFFLMQKRGWDISVKTLSQMSIKKPGIALWRGSGFLLRTLKNENEMFCLSLFFFILVHNVTLDYDHLILLHTMLHPLP